MKKLKLGYLLVVENIIDRKQLDKALHVQQANPGRSIGEVVSKLYDIPEAVVESLFMDHMVIPLVREQLRNDLERKFQGSGVEYNKEVGAIEIIIHEYHRKTTAIRTFVKENDKFYEPTISKQYLTSIYCPSSKILFHTVLGPTITMNDIPFEWDMHSQRATLENPAVLMEAKIRIIQLIKKQRSPAEPKKKHSSSTSPG